MGCPRLSRQTLHRAHSDAPIGNPKQGLLRLAKFVGIPIHDDCTCDKCTHELVEILVRKLDVQEKATWPPRLSERKW